MEMTHRIRLVAIALPILLALSSCVAIAADADPAQQWVELTGRVARVDREQLRVTVSIKNLEEAPVLVRLPMLCSYSYTFVGLRVRDAAKGIVGPVGAAGEVSCGNSKYRETYLAPPLAVSIEPGKEFTFMELIAAPDIDFQPASDHLRLEFHIWPQNIEFLGESSEVSRKLVVTHEGTSMPREDS